ncbi:MAG: hypothetical protein RLZ81_1212 [Pseudomonadota bacterium]
MWEEVHKKTHEKSLAELREIKSKLDTMEKNTQVYITLKSEYDSKFEAAQDFFLRLYE